MAIKISNLQRLSDQYETRNFVYSDLHLDFKRDETYSQEIEGTLQKNDTKMDYDESAVRNSIKNLFNTKPGQRFLFPNYGLDLHQFLFEPVSFDIGQLIGERIARAIELFEPRVKLRACNVVCLPEDNQYDITLVVEFPVFNTKASINSKLDMRTQSFIFVENHRNR